MRLPDWSVQSHGPAGEKNWNNVEVEGGRTYGRKVGVGRVDSHHCWNICHYVEHEGEVLENLQIYQLGCLVGVTCVPFSVKI